MMGLAGVGLLLRGSPYSHGGFTGLKGEYSPFGHNIVINNIVNIGGWKCALYNGNV